MAKIDPSSVQKMSDEFLEAMMKENFSQLFQTLEILKIESDVIFSLKINGITAKGTMPEIIASIKAFIAESYSLEVLSMSIGKDLTA
jgi:hypothetical protein